MISISLCMIVKNEEEVLARCLDSVRAAVDEIVIVDTGSTDKTVEIARSYTDKVYGFTWRDDFAAARNFAFARGTMDYLMWLDADDVLPPASLRGLLELKEKLDDQVRVVMMPYHVAFDGSGRPSFSYERERLIKNREGFQWQGAVHEAIAPIGKVYHSQVVVEHRKLKKGDPDRNLRIYEKQLVKGAELSPRERFYYARELYFHGRWGEAADEFRHFLNMPGAWLENRLDACRLAAACYEAMGEEEEAMHVLLESLTMDAPRAETCCEIGRQLMSRGNYRAAAFWYETAATREQSLDTGAFSSVDCYDYIPYMQLCVCYFRMGDREKAREYHRLAAKIKPEDAAVKYNEAFFDSLEAQSLSGA